MIELLIKLSLWLALLRQSFVSIIRVIFISGNTKEIKKIKINSDRLVVLGNGPSFKNSLESNFEFFKHQELICLNHFGITDYYTELKPKFYITIAHDLYLDDTDTMYKEASIKLFNAIADRTTWEMIFLIHREARKEKRWQEILRKNKNIRIVYINLTPAEGFKWLRYSLYKKSLGMVRPHNVMIPSMFFAINAGAKEIILVGAEHSWLKEIHVDKDNNALFFNEHFYNTEKKSQRYTFKGQSYMKLHEILKTLAAAFEGYHILNEYAADMGVKIINCSPESFIDAFEKRSLSDIKTR